MHHPYPVASKESSANRSATLSEVSWKITNQLNRLLDGIASCGIIERATRLPTPPSPVADWVGADIGLVPPSASEYPNHHSNGYD